REVTGDHCEGEFRPIFGLWVLLLSSPAVRGKICSGEGEEGGGRRYGGSPVLMVGVWWCDGDGKERRGRGRRRRGVATAIAGSGEEKRGGPAARFGFAGWEKRGREEERLAAKRDGGRYLHGFRRW
ncbi:hypothetical protein HAX54_012702, partial [Datura stramonium]|nr:hypothetical protein [Datura stramonium]